MFCFAHHPWGFFFTVGMVHRGLDSSPLLLVPLKKPGVSFLQKGWYTEVWTLHSPACASEEAWGFFFTVGMGHRGLDSSLLPLVPLKKPWHGNTFMSHITWAAAGAGVAEGACSEEVLCLGPDFELLKIRCRFQGQLGKCVLRWLIYCFFWKQLCSLVMDSVTIKMKCVKLLNDPWMRLMTLEEFHRKFGFLFQFLKWSQDSWKTANDWWCNFCPLIFFF